MKMCVIFNPAAGRGRATRRLKALRHKIDADFWPTIGPGHAEELAYRAAQEGFAVLGAAGGDGTVHEVANGLLSAGRPDVALAVFPIGSANDYAHSLRLDKRWWQSKEGNSRVRAVDVGLVQSPDGRQRYFVNGLGLGFNGAVTLEARRIRRLQGLALYGLALLRALHYRYETPLMTITFDGEARRGPTLALTVAIGRKEGSFLLAPKAEVDDGLFDYLHAGALGRWELLCHLPGMLTGRLPTDHPQLWMGRCRQVSVHSDSALTAHVDGEFFCRPEDDVRALEMGILPGALKVYRPE